MRAASEQQWQERSRNVIRIDGSMGEGGGQVLRTSLGLSLATGQPLEITGIRAGRKRPGLMRQHLTAVRAAAEIGGAEVSGDAIGSQSLHFAPRTVSAGSYRFAVGSAGSATLVLQTVLPALLTADGPSQLVLEGGTHNPWAPPYDFLALSFLPLLGRMGARVTATLERHGFYPAGGGRFCVEIEPVAHLKPLELLERGRIATKRARALISQLPLSIGERELKRARRRLSLTDRDLATEVVPDPLGPGNALLIELHAEHVTEVITGFGRLGVSAEHVANSAVREARRYIAAGVPVGEHLADQLLVPLALAGGGGFRTLAPSKHTRTNAEVIGFFLEVAIDFEERGRDDWLVTVRSRRQDP